MGRVLLISVITNYKNKSLKPPKKFRLEIDLGNLLKKENK